MHVAGYYMPFTSTRALMDKFQISDRGVDDRRLEFPINNWLAETGRTYVLAGAISHPRKGERNKEDCAFYWNIDGRYPSSTKTNPRDPTIGFLLRPSHVDQALGRIARP